MAISNNKTSLLINSQVPEFVRQDHTAFVEFLEDYYKFLEQENQVLNVTKNLSRYRDVDLAEGVFLQKLYDNFITLLPKDILANKTLILKHVKDFYRARGSEKSVRFLLRILFNKEATFYYPKVDVLKASNGKWYVEKSIRVGDIQVDNVANNIVYSNFQNKLISGNTSNATAVVETVDVYYDKGQLVTELKLSSEYRTFDDGEKIWCRFYDENGIDRYLSATIFSGIITSISLIDGGEGYVEGATVPIIGGNGSGGQVVISRTTKGTLTGIGVTYSGAGYQSTDDIFITGGGGDGGAASILTVDTSGVTSPNSYNIYVSTIGLEANTAIGNTKYSNLNSSITDPANNWIINSLSSFALTNCGPIISCQIDAAGNGYVSIPTVQAQGNTMLRSLGILGRMRINDGGSGYVVGNILEFINPQGSFGYAANGIVSTVDGGGAITNVAFTAYSVGYPLGGIGYNEEILPTVNVASGTGSGANIEVTCIAGGGAILETSTTTAGTIEELRLVSGGSGYTTAPYLDFEAMGSGTGAQAAAFIVTGSYTYPGRYLNDDGFLSSYNFLQDRDYYQNYSYVVRIDEPIEKYRKALKTLTHPAGMKLFGHYLLGDDNTIDLNVNTSIVTHNSSMVLSTYGVQIADIIKTGSYNVKSVSATFNTIVIPAAYSLRPSYNTSYNAAGTYLTIDYPSNGFKAGDRVYLTFSTNAYSNIINSYYTVSAANANTVTVPIANGNSAFIQLPANSSNLTLSTGSGANVSLANLSLWTINSNVSIANGDTINVKNSYTVTVVGRSGSNTVIVYPPLTGNIAANNIFVYKKPFYAYGNVRVYDPIITLFANGTGVIPNQNVYVKFSTSDTSFANDKYMAVTANGTMIKVSHQNVRSYVSTSGNANVYLNRIVITANNHGLSNSDVVFLSFATGDTTNTQNGLVSVTGATANTFTATMDNAVTAVSGTLSIRQSNVTINVTSHGFSTNDNVRIWFTSGDTSNISNTFYIVTVYDTNRFRIPVTTIPTSNGAVSLYRGYANVTINRTSHGLSAGGNVRVMFEDGNLAQIPNGIFRIGTVANANTFNITHKTVVLSSNLSNLLPNNSGNVYISSY